MWCIIKEYAQLSEKSMEILPVQSQICEKLACLGVKIDLDKNNVRGETIKISSDDSKIDVYVIPTNEELMIARETLELINNNR